MNANIRHIFAPGRNRLLRYRDLMDEYGLTYNGAYDLLHRYGVKLGGGLYIKRSVVERVLEGNKTTA